MEEFARVPPAVISLPEDLEGWLTGTQSNTTAVTQFFFAGRFFEAHISHSGAIAKSYRELDVVALAI